MFFFKLLGLTQWVKKTCKSETLARIIIIESLGWRTRCRSQQDKLFSWDCVTSCITLCLNPALEKVPTSPHQLGAVDMQYFSPDCAAQAPGCVVIMPVTVLNGGIHPSKRVIRHPVESVITPWVINNVKGVLHWFIDAGNNHDLFWGTS